MISINRIVFVAAMLCLGSLTSVPLSAQQTSLARLAYSSGWDALPSIVAIERGFFDQEDIVVSGMPVSSAQAVLQSLVSGSTDFAAVPQRTLLVAAAAKLPLTVVSINGWGTEMELIVPEQTRPEVPAQTTDAATQTTEAATQTTEAATQTTEAASQTPGVTSLEDLKGKTIAVGIGSEAFPILIRLLNAAGMAPTDVDIRSLDANTLTQSFQNQTADAIFESRHFTDALKSTGQARTLLSNGDIVEALGNIGTQPLLVRTELIETEPETVQKFVTAWVKALTYIGQDPEDAARLLRIFFHRQGVTISAGMAASWVSLTSFDRFTWTSADVTDAEYNGWGLKEGQILTVLPVLDGFVQNQFAERALEVLEESNP